ncbi:MAG TPA: hypothetical protein DCZ94_01650 [Lentisphaeria bacterium]|nr:MAG: hypothetical protein A2X48_21530 [Lentisphaerae bacterium GWF2_49_21]HBC85636.1 hypothetical protein [Lentisphaeria bacterium]
MARKSKRTHLVAGELNLTAMIDIAFQLLSFFLMTMKPVDVMALMDVSRPAPDSRAPAKALNVLTITILADEKQPFALNDRVIRIEDLDMMLCKAGELNPDQNVIVACMQKSLHSRLIDALDLCAKAKLTKLSVVSLM